MGLSRGKLTDVGVSENESPTQLIFMPVHFTANDTEKSFAINQNLHTVLFNDFIELCRFFHVLEVIGETGATTVLHTNSNKFRFRLIHQLAKLLCGDGSQLHGSFSCPKWATGFRGSFRWSCRGGLWLLRFGLSQVFLRVF